jgi:hypothetical protein
MYIYIYIHCVCINIHTLCAWACICIPEMCALGHTCLVLEYYTAVQSHLYIYIYIYIYTHTDTYTPMNIYIHTQTHILTLCVCVCIYIYIFICIPGMCAHGHTCLVLKYYTSSQSHLLLDTCSHPRHLYVCMYVCSMYMYIYSIEAIYY